MTLPPSSAADTQTALGGRWRHLNDWLGHHELIWRQSPFQDPWPDWAAQLPELADWLCGLGEDQCQGYERDLNTLAGAVSRWLPALVDYGDIASVPDLAASDELRARATLAERDARDMPGRKRQQAGAFAAALMPLQHGLLDWCCGKGHLARTLARSGAQSVTGFEWNGLLVDDGNRLVLRHGDPVTLMRQDVLAADLNWPADVHGVALHACGDLHRKLIRDTVALDQPRVSFSPCCYHLGGQQRMAPLSAYARGYGGCLQLERVDLRLAVQETVTAPARVRTQTAMARQWRLGFDGMQRQLRGEDQYLQLPSYPASLMGLGFEAFCQWAAERKGLALPASVDFGHWQAYGVERWHRVRRFELLRHLFRRPLELWLVLDYALCLEEAGYEVRLGTFCERALTPRNLLVDAVRRRER